MKMITDIAHDFLLENSNRSMIAVDFTMGLGYDSLFLTRYFQKVYAFEILPEAIDYAKDKFGELPIEVFNVGHEECRSYLPYYDRGIFYLGSLPKLNKKSATTKDTTLKALRHALDLLTLHGRLTVILSQNKEENEAVIRFLDALNAHDYEVAMYTLRNKKQAPCLLMIEKIGFI